MANVLLRAAIEPLGLLFYFNAHRVLVHQLATEPPGQRNQTGRYQRDGQPHGSTALGSVKRSSQFSDARESMTTATIA
ncbi:hypothetical protein HAALTHF_43520n [Vreelandella aquamarina]|nr:hypothetical protein HAALTHF_43520n [Halomonas axialensis]